MNSIKRMLPFLKGKYHIILLYMTANLLSVVFTTLTVGMISPFLDILFDKTTPITQNPGIELSRDGISQYFNYLLTHYIQIHNNDKVQGLVFVVIILIVSTILKNVFLFLSRYILNPLRNDIIRKIRRNFYEKMIALPIGFFSNERKGDIMSRMTNDMHAVEVSISSTMELLFSTPITVVFYFVILMTISLKLFLFLLVLLPLAGLLIGRISKSLKKSTQNNQERQANLLAIVEETLGGLRIIKAFKAENNRKEVFEKENTHLFQINNKIAMRRELASPLSEVLGIAILGVVVWYGGSMALKNPPEIEPGMFIMFISLFYFLIDPLKKLSQLFYNLHQGAAGLDRIHKIVDAENNIKNTSNPLPLKTFKDKIEFKNVSFLYENKLVLENISMTIKKGETVALVGASGAGKSTLVDLLPRLHDVAQGEIHIDDINIKTYAIEDVRAQIGVVSQDPILFNDTLSRNIALGYEQPNEKEIEQAAKVANAHTFILQKEHGYNSMIGDRGVKLSGGEKQRITIARAIYKNPAILILDEATSSLDTISERQVQDAIEQLMQNRTSIVIAHRLSTVQNADKIIVLDKGKIVEQGTHTELMAKGGQYQNLVNMQQVLS
ncbi:MAG: ABC transporter ATP-binding protein [Chitinophagaceae bacterium]